MARPHIHDGFFRRVFGRPELAADLLRRELPAEVITRLDLDRLEPVTTEFRDPSLRSRQADLVFKVPLADHSGRVAYVFVLMEHQSRPDPLMPLRLLTYAVEIWTGWVEAFRAEHGRNPRKLPAVIPVVFHQGRRPWSGPRTLIELIDLPAPMLEALRPHLPSLTLLLDDLAESGDLTRAVKLMSTVAALLTMSFVRQPQAHPDFAERWKDLVELTAGEPHQKPVLEAMVEYLYSSDAPLAPERMYALSREVADPDVQEVLMTLGDRLKDLGREEGRAEGRVAGRAEVRRRQADALLKLIQLKFGPPTPAVRARVESASEADLQRWTERILTAETPEALLA